MNKVRGEYIALYSLSTLGLKCVKVDPIDILNFKPEMAQIRLPKK